MRLVPTAPGLLPARSRPLTPGGLDAVPDARHGEVERRLTRLLGGWAALSVVAGTALWRTPRTRVLQATRDFGRQTACWGAVNGAIAVAGAVRRARGHRTTPQRLRRVLLVNAGLDVGYVAGGLALLHPPSRLAPRPRPGDALAVVVQGLVLLALDGWAARRLTQPLTTYADRVAAR